MYFENIIKKLKEYWIKQGCTELQGIDTEVGAATLHPETMIKTYNKKTWNIVFLQPCRRPKDYDKYHINKEKIHHYYQLQVLMKPSPINFKEKCIKSLDEVNIKHSANDITFINNNWENSAMGAKGVGWEIYCNGTEILQFTYMQILGGMKLKIIAGEIAYGIERITMQSQNINNIWKIKWSYNNNIYYKDIFLTYEKEFIILNKKQYLNKNILKKKINILESIAHKCIEKKLKYTAYIFCIKISHIFNMMESINALSKIEKKEYIKKIYNISVKCCKINKI